MFKRCIVKLDELNKPVALIEVKEFTDEKSLKDFKELCNKNAMEQLERKMKTDKKVEEEKAALNEQIKGLTENVTFLIRAIKKIFGVSTREEIEAMLKEVNNDEKEN